MERIAKLRLGTRGKAVSGVTYEQVPFGSPALSVVPAENISTPVSQSIQKISPYQEKTARCAPLPVYFTIDVSNTSSPSRNNNL